MLGTVVIAALPQAGSSIVRIDSREQGRTFDVDTDRPEIRAALRDVSAPSPPGSIPTWLPPYPDAKTIPHDASKDPVDFGVALYATGAAPDIVFAHYDSAIRAAGAKVTYVNRQPCRLAGATARSREREWPKPLRESGALRTRVAGAASARSRAAARRRSCCRRTGPAFRGPRS